MSRSFPWRHTSSDVVHARQLQAIQARIYVLQENGPTAFTVKEHDSPKKLRVTLGDPCACTCSTFIRERELCIHILWVMLKVFRIPPENPISWQGGLVEREIQQIVKSRELTRRRGASSIVENVANKKGDHDQMSVVEPRPIEEGDCCPICQDEMEPSQHLTFCRYSCGHSIHSKCMKIWADHQISQGTKILCPMCRADFGTMKMIMTDHLKHNAVRRDAHPGTTCNNCNANPIQGKHYLCTICQQYSLCMQCFAGPNHTQHPFQFKEKPSHRWRPAVRDLSTLPPTLTAELENRDITENDYEALLALDESATNATGGLSARELAGLKCIMLTKKSSLLKQRELHCGICLAGYTISQHVLELPCSHKFHKVCGDNWLSHTHDYCPTCNEPVVVSLPQRKRTSVVRFNQKDEIPDELKLEFSMTGNSLQSAGLQTNQNKTPQSGSLQRGNLQTMSSSKKPLHNENRGLYVGALGGLGGLGSSSIESLQSSGSSSAALNDDRSLDNTREVGLFPGKSKAVMKGRRATPNKNTLPSFTDVKGQPLSVGTSNNGSQANGRETKKPHALRPPRVPREKNSDPVICDLELDMRGGTSGSPVEIIRRISSVNEQSTSGPPGKGKRRITRDKSRSRSPSVHSDMDVQPNLVLVSGKGISL